MTRSPDLEFLAVRADFDDLAARLVAGDGAGLVAFRAFAEMRAVDGANVAAANGAGLHLDQNLAGPGLGTGNCLNSTVLLPGKTTPVMVAGAVVIKMGS